MHSIYALSDPQTGCIVYIGKTGGPLNSRLRGHCNDAKRKGGTIARFTWINRLAAVGLVPLIHLIESVDPDRVNESETKWIKHFRDCGVSLLNRTNGGDGVSGYRHTELAKSSMAAKAIARNQDPAHRAKVGAAVAIALSKPASRQRLRDARKRTLMNPDYLAWITQHCRELSSRVDVRAARGAKLKGRIFTDEHRRKISESRLGKKLSPEVCANMAAGHRGLKYKKRNLNKAAQTC